MAIKLCELDPKPKDLTMSKLKIFIIGRLNSYLLQKIGMTYGSE